MIALHQNEKLLGAYRKTWIAFLGTVVSALALTLLPFALPLLINSLPALPDAHIPGGLLALVAVLWWWIVWTGLFLAFTNYYLDVFIVTNERVVHIEQLGLFRRRIAELRMERVQDVMIEQLGFLATMLHFGNVRVQTAGETGSFSFRAIPHPMRVKELIMSTQRQAVLREHGAAHAAGPHTDPST